MTSSTTSSPGYADKPITKMVPWHGLVVWDVLLNGLTTGLFLASAVAEAVSPDVFGRVVDWAYPVALVLLLADLVCLVLDLGDPLRFHHMLRVFKPSSPMSFGVWALTIYSLPLTTAAALSLLPERCAVLEGVRGAAVALGVLPALASALYKGVLFSTSSQPGWREARWLGGYLTNAALVLGCAELLALAVLLEEERAAALLRPALVALLACSLLPLGLLVANVRHNLIGLYGPMRLWMLAALVLGCQLMGPLFLLLISNGMLASLAAVGLLLVGSWISRDVLVRLPQGAT